MLQLEIVSLLMTFPTHPLDEWVYRPQTEKKRVASFLRSYHYNWVSTKRMTLTTHEEIFQSYQ